jgi:hypothetical protein
MTKNPFTKEQQIKGLKKMLANRKTPAGLRKSAKTRLAKRLGK